MLIFVIGMGIIGLFVAYGMALLHQVANDDAKFIHSILFGAVIGIVIFLLSSLLGIFIDYDCQKEQYLTLQAQKETLEQLHNSDNYTELDKIAYTQSVIELNNKIIEYKTANSRWYANPFCKQMWTQIEPIT